MKKELLIVGIGVAVVICILAAGCTGTVSDQKQPDQTTPTETYTAEDAIGMWESALPDVSYQLILKSNKNFEYYEVDNNKITATKSILGTWDISGTGSPHYILTKDGSAVGTMGASIGGSDKTAMILYYDVNDLSNCRVLTKVSNFKYHPTYEGLDTQGSAEGVTVGQENALKRAKEYTASDAGYSYWGLEDLLMAEGFTEEQAFYAVNNCGADWYQEAVKKVQACLKLAPLSYNDIEIILRNCDFNPVEIEYGLDHCGILWTSHTEKRTIS